MVLLVLKVTLAPLLVAAGSAAQRRWGQAVGGRIVGLPLTSLPLLYLLALADGTRFAATAAVASLAGVSAQAVLTWVYAKVAGRRGPLVSVGAAVAAFAATAGVLAAVPLGPAAAAIVGTFVLVALLLAWPASLAPTAPPATAGTSAGADGPPTPPSDATRNPLALRMVLAASFSFAVSEAAAPLGPRLAGLVAALPVLSIVLFALTHRDEGAPAARQFAHGVQRGSFSVVAALFVLAVVLPSGHLALAFGGALAASVVAQLVAGLATQRPVAAASARV